MGSVALIKTDSDERKIKQRVGGGAGHKIKSAVDNPEFSPDDRPEVTADTAHWLVNIRKGYTYRE